MACKCESVHPRGEKQLTVVSLQLLVRREEKSSWSVLRVWRRCNRDGMLTVATKRVRK